MVQGAYGLTNYEHDPAICLDALFVDRVLTFHLHPLDEQALALWLYLKLVLDHHLQLLDRGEPGDGDDGGFPPPSLAAPLFSYYFFRGPLAVPLAFLLLLPWAPRHTALLLPLPEGEPPEPTLLVPLLAFCLCFYLKLLGDVETGGLFFRILARVLVLLPPFLLTTGFF